MNEREQSQGSDNDVKYGNRNGGRKRAQKDEKVINKILVVGEKHKSREETELVWYNIFRVFDKSSSSSSILYIHEPVNSVFSSDKNDGEKQLKKRKISEYVVREVSIETSVVDHPYYIADMEAFKWLRENYDPKSFQKMELVEFMRLGMGARCNKIKEAIRGIFEKDEKFFWIDTECAKKLEDRLGVVRDEHKKSIECSRKSKDHDKKIDYMMWQSLVCAACYKRLEINKSWRDNIFRIVYREAKEFECPVNIFVIVGNAHMGSWYSDVGQVLPGMVALFKEKDYLASYNELIWGWNVMPTDADKFTDKEELNIHPDIVTSMSTEDKKIRYYDRKNKKFYQNKLSILDEQQKEKNESESSDDWSDGYGSDSYLGVARGGIRVFIVPQAQKNK